MKMFVHKLNNKFNYRQIPKSKSEKLVAQFYSAGFTMVELIIVIGIITVISVLVLVKYPNFSEKQSLDRAAKSIALAIRDAQIKALATVEFSPSVFPAYGVHFDSSINDSYIIFADINNNQQYDSPGEMFEQKKIITSARITDLCAYLKSADPDQCGLPDLDIIFKRPEPLIFLKSSAIMPNISDVEIIAQTPSGMQRTIGVWLSGQVFIE